MNEIKATSSGSTSTKWLRIIKISKYAWLAIGLLFALVIAAIESGAISWLISLIGVVIGYWFEALTGYVHWGSGFVTVLQDLQEIMTTGAAIFGRTTIFSFIWQLLLSFTYIFKYVPGVLAIFSLIHVLQLFVKKPLIKPGLMIFRGFTLLFSAVSVFFAMLFTVGLIGAYDFARAFVLFSGGTIVLCIFSE